MAVALSTLEPLVSSRLEETSPPVFWEAREIRNAIVEAFNECVLITGEPEVRLDYRTTIQPFTNLQTMPPEAVAILRMQGENGPIQKSSVTDLDRIKSDWQTETGPRLKNWFPIGLTQFGTYPKLMESVSVVLTIVEIPIAQSRPYTGLETADFQQEYMEAFVRYASSVLRLKEGGPEFQQGLKDYEYFLDKMGQFTNFGTRKHQFRFTRSVGHTSNLTDVEKK